jgi:hypothetical protein
MRVVEVVAVNLPEQTESEELAVVVIAIFWVRDRTQLRILAAVAAVAAAVMAATAAAAS